MNYTGMILRGTAPRASGCVSHVARTYVLYICNFMHSKSEISTLYSSSKYLFYQPCGLFLLHDSVIETWRRLLERRVNGRLYSQSVLAAYDSSTYSWQDIAGWRVFSPLRVLSQHNTQLCQSTIGIGIICAWRRVIFSYNTPVTQDIGVNQDNIYIMLQAVSLYIEDIFCFHFKYIFYSFLIPFPLPGFFPSQSPCMVA